MKHITDRLSELWRNEAGAVAVEYGIIAAALMIAIYPAFQLITSALNVKFTMIADAFSFFQ